jgi:hypothetical protein
MTARRSAILLGIVLVSLFVYLLHPTTLHSLGIPRQSQSDHPTTIVPHRRLHFLLPINARTARASSRFCKTLLSAFVHGYAPVVLNWETEGDVEFTQRMKVFGTCSVL